MGAGRDQGRAYRSAGADHGAASVELAGDRLEQRPVQAAAHQLGAEADEGGALGRGLAGGEAAEPVESGAVVQRLASRTSKRSCQVASSTARNSTGGGQPGLTLAITEMPTRARSISAQSSRAASPVNDDAARGSGRAMRSSCPIRRHAIATSHR